LVLRRGRNQMATRLILMDPGAACEHRRRYRYPMLRPRLRATLIREEASPVFSPPWTICGTAIGGGFRGLGFAGVRTAGFGGAWRGAAWRGAGWRAARVGSAWGWGGRRRGWGWCFPLAAAGLTAATPAYADNSCLVWNGYTWVDVCFGGYGYGYGYPLAPLSLRS
jgi:hypothetical protein